MYSKHLPGPPKARLLSTTLANCDDPKNDNLCRLFVCSYSLIDSFFQITHQAFCSFSLASGFQRSLPQAPVSRRQIPFDYPGVKVSISRPLTFQLAGYKTCNQPSS
jgi:hypothetical protein